MAVRWRADDGPKLNAGSVALLFLMDLDQNFRIAKKPYIFVIFQGGGGGVRTPCTPPSGYAHDLCFVLFI